MSYYVYYHCEPTTGEIVYVGHGRKHRAWLMDEPFRSKEHAKYLDDLNYKGFNPSDWVRIETRNQSKEDACFIERQKIKEWKPRYNKIQGAALLKFTPELLAEAVALRDMSWSYQKIADHFGFSTMTVHRSINGGSPALEEILERSK